MLSNSFKKGNIMDTPERERGREKERVYLKK